MKNSKLIYVSFLVLILSFQSPASNLTDESYKYSIDLNNVRDSKLPVTLIPPETNKNDVIFHFPAIVPGMYHISDFGRFVTEVQAFDKNGNELAVIRLDSNSWRIKGGNISRITYYVEDSWNTSNPNNRIFQPAGLNLEENKNYVVNPSCLFGYLDELKNKKFDITIRKPENFYGSTALVPVFSDKKTDKYELDSYYDLTDSPIMYDLPDTSVIKVGETTVLISVYSPNKKVNSKFLAQNLKDILYGQLKYLGGKLPVKKYAYIVYFATQDELGTGVFGALEHNNSSMYFIPENDEAQIRQLVINFAAHEFFHIITPLNIHSQEIQNFNYETPKMSQHLWLYEGVTEYSAMIFQVKEGLVSRKDFLKTVKEKLNYMDRLNDTIPFTELSKTVLNRSLYEYINVYYKGALIGLCLDLKLRDLSNGSFGIRDMMNELSKRYGKNKAFNDDELFDVITSFTYPEIRAFFKSYVEGSDPLPLKEYLNYAGIDYDKVKATKDFSFGQVAFSGTFNNKYIEVVDVSKTDEIGKEMGYEKGDQIKKINGIEAPILKFRETVTAVLTNAKEGDTLSVVVIRKDKNGNEKDVTLKTLMRKVDVNKYHVLNIKENADEKQLKVRDSWLGEN